MVVGIDRRIVAPRLTQQLERYIGNHLVGIHVGGGAGSALQHVDHEVVVLVAGDDEVAGGDDCGGGLRRQPAVIAVGQCRRLLDHGEGFDEFGKVRQCDAGDREVFHRAGGVDAVVGLRRYLHFADGIAFGTHAPRHHQNSHIDLARCRDVFFAYTSIIGWISACRP